MTGLFRQRIPWTSKLESGDQLTLPRRAEGRADVDVSEPGCRLTETIVLRSRQRVGRRRIAHFRAIENVGELRADLKAGFFLNPENAAQAQVLYRPPLIAEVTVVSCRRAPFPRPRIGPCRRIECEGLAGIEAMTIEIL